MSENDVGVASRRDHGRGHPESELRRLLGTRYLSGC